LSDAAFRGGCCTLVLAVARQQVGSARVRFELTAIDPRTLRLEALRSKSGRGAQLSIPLASLLPGDAGDPRFGDLPATRRADLLGGDDVPSVKRSKLVWEPKCGGMWRKPARRAMGVA